jgi:hypothetical protein
MLKQMVPIITTMVVEIINTMHKFAQLLYSCVLAPTCFGSKSAIFREILDPSELRENRDRYCSLSKIYNR